MLAREAFINVFLKHLMDTYYASVESKEIMDDIQSDVSFNYDYIENNLIASVVYI